MPPATIASAIAPRVMVSAFQRLASFTSARHADATIRLVAGAAGKMYVSSLNPAVEKNTSTSAIQIQSACSIGGTTRLRRHESIATASSRRLQGKQPPKYVR